MITIGDLVTRKSYNNDIVFEVINIEGNEVVLKGVDIRLIADAKVNDLIPFNRNIEDGFCPDINLISNLDRNEFFYLPGKILHIDADKSYLERCLEYYKKNNLKVIGKNIKESDMYKEIEKLLKL